jgi:hypothetical protein
LLPQVNECPLSINFPSRDTFCSRQATLIFPFQKYIFIITPFTLLLRLSKIFPPWNPPFPFLYIYVSGYLLPEVSAHYYIQYELIFVTVVPLTLVRKISIVYFIYGVPIRNHRQLKSPFFFLFSLVPLFLQ